MAPNNRLTQGLAILRAIAQSDAVKDVRGRLREGAIALAESERIPRLVAAGAGIVAALLDEPAEVYGRESSTGVDSWSVDEGEAREDLRDGAERQEHDAELDADEAPEPEDAARLRDLGDVGDLEEHLMGADEQTSDDEDDGDERLLRFDEQEVAEEEDEGAEAAPAKAIAAAAPSRRGVSDKARSKAPKRARAKGGPKTKPSAKAKAPRVPRGTKPSEAQQNAPSAKPRIRRAPRKK